MSTKISISYRTHINNFIGWHVYKDLMDDRVHIEIYIKGKFWSHWIWR